MTNLLQEGKDALTSLSSLGALAATGAGASPVIADIVSTGTLPIAWHPYIVIIAGLISFFGTLRRKQTISTIAGIQNPLEPKT